MFWTGGRANHGHIAMALGDGTIRSTDSGGAGQVATLPLAWVEQALESALRGWTGDLEGVVIPWLAAGDLAGGSGARGAGAGGPVVAHGWTGARSCWPSCVTARPTPIPYVGYSTRSTRSPCRRRGNITLPLHGNYDDQTDVVVRTRQRHVGNQPDPAKKSSIGPKQAQALFGCPPYQLG